MGTTWELSRSSGEQGLSAAPARTGLKRSAAPLPRLGGSLAIGDHQLSNAALLEALCQQPGVTLAEPVHDDWEVFQQQLRGTSLVIRASDQSVPSSNVAFLNPSGSDPHGRDHHQQPIGRGGGEARQPLALPLRQGTFPPPAFRPGAGRREEQVRRPRAGGRKRRKPLKLVAN